MNSDQTTPDVEETVIENIVAGEENAADATPKPPDNNQSKEKHAITVEPALSAAKEPEGKISLKAERNSQSLSSPKSRNVPHTFLDLPDGKKICISLPVSSTQTRGTYGETISPGRTSPKPTKPSLKPSSNYGFSASSLKFIIAGIILITLSILFYFLADKDTDFNTRLLILLIGCGLGLFTFVCSNAYICKCGH